MDELGCDVLVIGGGAAGSRAALEAKRSCPALDVALAIAGKSGHTGSTALIASESLGINAPFNFTGDGDGPDVYLQDMLATGGGLSSAPLCRIIADEACARIEDLISLGVRFDMRGEVPIQTRLSGCTKARSLTCGGSTGREILRVLARANAEAGVRVLEDVRILDLCRADDGRVVGALGLARGEPVVVRAHATVLATGGAGRLFKKNVNPPGLEGDGWAMALRAGARLVNLEFFQIGPGVTKPRIPFIIHSHMWKLKPRLTNARGEEFVGRYCPPGTSPDDVIDAKTMSYPFSVRTIARYLDIAIFKELMAGRGTESGGVLFDVTHVGEGELRRRAPITYDTLRRAGADLATTPIELGLFVQNFNGGVLIDRDGHTGVEGLYAAGEVTGGVHGADRPGGNNLIDTQVFGCRAGRAAAIFAEACATRKTGRPGAPPPDAAAFRDSPDERSLADACAELYYRELTVVRRAEGLRRVLAFTAENAARARGRRAANGLLVGRMLALAALTREESRGTHYREDFPDTDSRWNRRIFVGEDGAGEPIAEVEPR